MIYYFGIVLLISGAIASSHTAHRAQPGAVVNCTQKAAELHLTNLGGKYYLFSNENLKLNWESADDYCHSRGLTLASIESRSENDKIVAHLLQLRTGNYLDGTWTSGMRSAQRWVWGATGEPLHFNAWYEGHPLPDGRRDRLAISGWRSKVRWVSLSKQDVRRFLCELQAACSQ